jgi:NAD(P)-dependent dehydrogenase (short-subunit alcohol dehydrogenase family)
MASDDVVLVTGANTGLGFQIIRALYSSSKTYNILLGGRSITKAEDAARAVSQEFTNSSSKISPIQVDIEDDDSIEKAFREVKSRFGRLDALINNAGTYSPTEALNL